MFYNEYTYTLLDQKNIKVLGTVTSNHRYLLEVDYSSRQIKSAKSKDK